MKNLTFYTSDLQHNIQKTKIPHVLRTRYSFIQGKPIKASHRRLALEGSRVQESLEWLSRVDFPHVHAVWHTQQPCAAIRREWTPFVYNVHFLVLQEILEREHRTTLPHSDLQTFPYDDCLPLLFLIIGKPFSDVPYTSCYYSLSDQLHLAKVLNLKPWNNTALLEYSCPPQYQPQTLKFF